jgi:hypothetical protein
LGQWTIRVGSLAHPAVRWPTRRFTGPPRGSLDHPGGSLAHPAVRWPTPGEIEVLDQAPDFGAQRSRIGGLNLPATAAPDTCSLPRSQIWR